VKVRLKIPMSGLRGGVDWPPVGAEMDVDDEEGAHLCHAGIAEPVVEERTEKAVAAEAEKRTEKAAAPAAEKRGSTKVAK
jgi:hypothetical protein